MEASHKGDFIGVNVKGQLEEVYRALSRNGESSDT